MEDGVFFFEGWVAELVPFGEDEDCARVAAGFVRIFVYFDGAIRLEKLETGGSEKTLDLILYIFWIASGVKDGDLRWVISK